MDTLSLLDRGTSSTCLVLARLSQRSLGSVLARRLSVRPRLVQGRSSAWSSKTLPAGPARGGHRHVLPGRLHLLAPQGRDILGVILLLPLIFISSLRALRIELGARAALVGLSGPVGFGCGRQDVHLPRGPRRRAALGPSRLGRSDDARGLPRDRGHPELGAQTPIGLSGPAGVAANNNAGIFISKLLAHQDRAQRAGAGRPLRPG